MNIHQKSTNVCKHKEQNCRKGANTRNKIARKVQTTCFHLNKFSCALSNTFCRPSLLMFHLNAVAGDFLPDGAKEHTHVDAPNCVLHHREMHEKSLPRSWQNVADKMKQCLPRHTKINLPIFCDKLPILVWGEFVWFYAATTTTTTTDIMQQQHATIVTTSFQGILMWFELDGCVPLQQPETLVRFHETICQNRIVHAHWTPNE